MQRRSTWERAAAIVEVTLAFVAVHVGYRAIKQFTVVGAWDAAAGANLTPGIVMIAVTVAILLLCRKSFPAYGLTCARWQENLSLGVACAVTTALFDGLGLAISGYEFDATRPPDPHAQPPWGKLFVLVGFVTIGGLAALAIVAGRLPALRKLPPIVTIPLLLALATSPIIYAAALHRSFSWPVILWLMVGAGFGEEIFFRGYIQSRVDEAFGRPCRRLGFEFGVGLAVSSLLFGLVHALNTVDYFHGRFDFGWRMGLQSVLIGAYYGLIRARTGSILPGAIAHGLSDVLARMPTISRG